MKSFFSKYNFLILNLVVCLSIFVLLVIQVQSTFAQGNSFLKTRVETVKSPKLKDEARVKQILRNLEVPEGIGFIKDVHVPVNSRGKLVINIQDLHCNYKAQKNIAAIIDYLVKTYGMRVKRRRRLREDRYYVL